MAIESSLVPAHPPDAIAHKYSGRAKVRALEGVLRETYVHHRVFRDAIRPGGFAAIEFPIKTRDPGRADRGGQWGPRQRSRYRASVYRQGRRAIEKWRAPNEVARDGGSRDAARGISSLAGPARG